MTTHDKPQSTRELIEMAVNKAVAICRDRAAQLRARLDRPQHEDRSDEASYLQDEIRVAIRVLKSSIPNARILGPGEVAVPMEPTKEMLEAVNPFPEHLRAEHPNPNDAWHNLMEAATLTDQAAARQIYLKMISSSPQHSGAGEKRAIEQTQLLTLSGFNTKGGKCLGCGAFAPYPPAHSCTNADGSPMYPPKTTRHEGPDFNQEVNLHPDVIAERYNGAGEQKAASQGRCKTTLTERFEYPECRCGTYEGNLGPCKTFEEGAEIGRCVYCDHKIECHEGLLAKLAPAAPDAEAGQKPATIDMPPGTRAMPSTLYIPDAEAWRLADQIEDAFSVALYSEPGENSQAIYHLDDEDKQRIVAALRKGKPQ